MDLVILSLILFLISLIVILKPLFKLDCDLTLWFYSKFGKSTKQFDGKVVWITGASSGIGAAIAVELAKSGAKLVLSGTNLTALKNTVAECLASNRLLKPNDVLIIQFDLTKVEEHEKHYRQIVSHFGKLDYLFANAGRGQCHNFETTSLETDRANFEVNVFATINLARVVIMNWLVREQSGHITVTSSVAGKYSSPMSSTYTATKHALHGYFTTAAIELQRMSITFTLACPGPVESAILERSFTHSSIGVRGNMPQRRMKFMTAQRCAKLMLIATINKLEEVWVVMPILLPLSYISQYMPWLTRRLFGLVMTETKLNQLKAGDF